MTEILLNIKSKGYDENLLVSDLENLNNLDTLIVYKNDYTEVKRYVLLDNKKLILLDLSGLSLAEVTELDKSYINAGIYFLRKGNPISINLELVEKNRTEVIDSQYDAKFTIYRVNQDLYMKLNSNQLDALFINLSGDEGVITQDGFNKLVADTKYTGSVSFSDGSSSKLFNLSISKYTEVVKLTDVDKIEVPAIDEADIINIESIEVISTTNNKLVYNVLPLNTTNRLVTFTTTTPEILDVDEKGIYTFKDFGVGSITVQSVENADVLQVVEVKNDAFSIMPYKLDQKTMVFSGKASPNTTIIVEYDNVTYTDVISSTGVFNINLKRLSNSNGSLKAYLKSSDGKLTSQAVYVTVDVIIDSATVNVNNVDTYIGGTGTLNINIRPEITRYKSGTFTSTDVSVVSIGQDGTWKANRIGQAEIKWTSDTYNSINTTTVFNVNPKLTSFYIQSDLSNNVLVGDTGKVNLIKNWINGVSGTTAFEYEIEDVNIMSIDDNGEWEAHNAGKTTLNVTADSMTSKIDVMVNNVPENITIVNETNQVEVGSSIKIILDIEPKEFLIPFNIRWTSSNSNIARVNTDGILTGIYEGDIEVTAHIDDFNISITEVFTVVSKPEAIHEFTINNSAYETINVGESIKFNYTYTPTNVDTSNILVESTDTSIVEIVDGYIIAKKTGTCYVSVTDITNVDLKKSIAVSVVLPTVEVEDITLNTTDVDIILGETFKLDVDVVPEDATNKEVIYSIEDTNVATISNDGLITSVGVGSTVVEITTPDAKFYKLCNVKVASDDIITITTLPNKSYSVNYGNTFNIKVNATSSKSAKVSYDLLDANGNTVVTTDSTTIKVDSKAVYELGSKFTIKAYTSENSILTEEFDLIVKDVYTASLGDNLDLTVGDSHQLVPKFTKNGKEYNTTDILWDSADNNIASVSYDGLVKANNEGVVIISILADNSITSDVTLTINKLVEETEPTEEESSSETSEDEPTESL